MPIYLVGHKDGSVRLIRAGMKSQAIAHAARTEYTVRVASQDDLIERLKAGVEVESLKNPDQIELV